MKNKAIIATLAAFGCLSASADITVNVAPTAGQTNFEVQYGYVNDLTKSRMNRPSPEKSNFDASSGKFVIKTLPDGLSYYRIPTEHGEYVMIYSMPLDNITVDIKGTTPLDYRVTGTKMMEDISRLDMQASNMVSEVQQLLATGQATESDVEKFEERVLKIFNDFISANPDADATSYAIINLQGQDFLNAYNNMTDKAKQSPLYALVEAQLPYEQRRVEVEKNKAELSNGGVTAPDFTFKNAEGKPVSLSDFRGKWVVIDFWGTWCPWCIKGFPALKEAYKELKPKLEIIGVACNDKYENWLNGLKKYDLPWVNVYNPEDGGGKILQDYAVEGFPTKVIVSPEGKIMNITAGENPDFFNILKELVK